MVSVFAATAFAADCKVNDSDISDEYVGGCVNGLAEGKGKAKGRDIYEGEFKQGNKHGKGKYTWVSGDKYGGDWLNGKISGKGILAHANGEKYEGSWLDNKRHGKGILISVAGEKYDGNFVNHVKQGYGVQFYLDSSNKYEGEWLNGKYHGYGKLTLDLKEETGIKSWGDSGKAIGNKFIVEGMFENQRFVMSCTSPQNCKQVQAKREAQERRDQAARAANVCNNVYPGKTGTRKGPSMLSIDVNYVVRYVNKDRGTATIEATNSGQLNMNRGEMKEVSCDEL